VGAIPVCADIDADSQCVTAATIRAVLTEKTRAIVVVHLAGWPCPMDEIMEMAAERGLTVIEDCAQANGAVYRGKPAGAWGHAAAFSFCQDKIISTGGEGGMLLLDDESAFKRAWAYKDIGRSYDAVYNRQHPIGFRWLTESFGSNWRLTEMQAAIGRIQLRKLPDWHARRARNAAFLTDRLADLPALRIPAVPPDVVHAWYRLYVFVRTERLKAGWTRDRMLAALDANGVLGSVGTCSEIYREKAFTDRGWGPAAPLPVAKQLGETSLVMLVHPTLSDDVLTKTAEIMRAVVMRASV
jgi:dTDP-4-amino-4,6-dideoxygalactose transaminase